MHLLTPSTTEAYLRQRGELDSQESVRVTELSGGVSNEVLLVQRGRGDRFVLKQAREQLRVKDDWRCDIRRIWREIDVLRLCGEILRQVNLGRESGIAASAPDVLFEDRENYCYAMTAAPAEHRTWKQHLLAGRIDLKLAAVVGRMLGELHARTWQDERVHAMFADQSYFDALRIDPYYRFVAERDAEFREPLEELSELARLPLALVHGDFSPKNLLVSEGQVMLIDFEVGHYGDPAFDGGFLLSHVLLKGIAAGPRCDDFRRLAQLLWAEYGGIVQPVLRPDHWQALNCRTVLHLAGCLLARVAGKSQVDYLNERQRTIAREIARSLFQHRPQEVEHAVAYLTRYVPW